MVCCSESEKSASLVRTERVKRDKGQRNSVRDIFFLQHNIPNYLF